MVTVSVAIVPPTIVLPLQYHCTVGAGEPVAAAVKTTFVPVLTAWLAGLVVIAFALLEKNKFSNLIVMVSSKNISIPFENEPSKVEFETSI